MFKVIAYAFTPSVAGAGDPEIIATATSNSQITAAQAELHLRENYRVVAIDGTIIVAFLLGQENERDQNPSLPAR